jgi:integrase
MAMKPFYVVKRRDRLTKDASGKLKPTFYVRFRDEGGALMPWQSTGETSKTRAELWAFNKLKAGKPGLPEHVTFGTYAAGWWTKECRYCDSREARGVMITTGYRNVRRSYLKNHILPRFGNVLLGKLSTNMIESWVMGLRKGKLSPTTINHALRTLKIMTAEAVRLGQLAADPAKNVRQLKEKPAERGILTLDEIRRLFDEKRLSRVWDGDIRHYALNMTAASCGLRLGEVLGLTVEHVHSDYLEIVFAWGQADGLQDPKWHKTRLVPLPLRTSTALQKVIQENEYHEPTDLLFYGEKRDRPVAHQVVLRRFYAALDAIDIDEEARARRGIVFHSHRHGFNSYCRGKVPDELLRAVIGHADERMTDRYFHPGLEAIKELSKVQEKLLG